MAIFNFFSDLFRRRALDHETIDLPYEGPKLSHGQMWVGDKPLGLLDDVNIPDGLAHAKVTLPSDEVDKIRAIPIPLDDMAPDALYWPTSPNGAFSVRDAYRYIVGGGTLEDMDWVWKIKVSERCRLCLWLMVKNKLLTNEERMRRQLTDDSSCMACGEMNESVEHIIKHCDVARVCWRISQTPITFVHGVSSTFMQWLLRNCSGDEIINGIPWGIIFSYTCWELWKARNRRIFDHVRTSPLEIVWRAEFAARESLQFGYQRKPEPMGRMRWVEGAIGIIFSGRLTEVSNLESRFIQSCVLTAILVEAKRKPDNEVQEIGAPKTVTLTLRLPPVIRFSSDPN
nr:LINE-type retrotransposon LIb DNA [Ipomoea batatas]